MTISCFNNALLTSFLLCLRPARFVVGFHVNFHSVRRPLHPFADARTSKRSHDILHLKNSIDDLDDWNINQQQEDDDEQKKSYIEIFNGVLKETRTSFGYVEKASCSLLSKQPALAAIIFVSFGIFVAYLLGLLFLGGYISSANPYENGAVPYWDDP